MYYPLTSSTRTPNFPQKPRGNPNVYSFPNDLVADGRNFYTQMMFVEYSFAQQNIGGVFGGTIANPQGGFRLPIPRRLNDVETFTWAEKDGIGTAASLAGVISRYRNGGRVTAPTFLGAVGSAAAVVAPLASAVARASVNPFLFMYFQRPNYKEHTLSWSLAPSSPQESATLQNIINSCKNAARPNTVGPVMLYPQIALIRMYPNDIFGSLLFKPCAIISVSVDYNGAATPSFFKRTGAPTVVNLNLHLKEIQLWDKNNQSLSQTGIDLATRTVDGVRNLFGGAN